MKVKLETSNRLILFVWRRFPLEPVDAEPTEYVTLDSETTIAEPFGFVIPYYEEEEGEEVEDSVPES